jgi:hypothetical protein
MVWGLSFDVAYAKEKPISGYVMTMEWAFSAALSKVSLIHFERERWILSDGRNNLNIVAEY